MKIDKLSSEQIDRMAEFRDKWISIGLSTEPAQRDVAERAIVEMYSAAKLEPPRKIVWCGSPLSQCLTRAAILDQKVWDSVRASVRGSVWGSVGDSVRASVGDSVGDSVGASVGASVWGSVGGSVRASVRASVGDSVGDSVRDSVWGIVWASVGDSVWGSVGGSVGASVWGSVGASVWASVGDSVRASVRASVWGSVGDSGYGQHDANWLAFYEYFREVCGLTRQTESLSGHFRQAKSAGWYLPHANICWVSERHNLLTRDESGRLHSVSGPAVTFPDGWSIYAWHGVRVPGYVIERPSDINTALIRAEQNTEVRRVMVERMGWDRYCSEAGMRVIHEDEMTCSLPSLPVSDTVSESQRLVIGFRKGVEKVQLLEATELRDFEDRPLRFVRVTDPSTGRQYTIRVAHDSQRCYEAIGASFGMTESQYRNTVYRRQGDVLLRSLKPQRGLSAHS